jgi:ankyrin repeat protein
MSNCLTNAVIYDKYETFTKLLKNKITENAKHFINDNNTCISLNPVLLDCARHSRYQMMKFLLNTVTCERLDEHDRRIIEHEDDTQHFCNRLFNINAVDDNNRSALILVVDGKNNVQLVRLLLQHKRINVSLRDDNGHTAFMHASIRKLSTHVRLLLRHPDVNVNDTNPLVTWNKRSALIQVVCTNHDDDGVLCARQLLDCNDVNVSYMDETGNTAVSMALNNDTLLIHALCTHGWI